MPGPDIVGRGLISYVGVSYGGAWYGGQCFDPICRVLIRGIVNSKDNFVA